MRPIQVNDLIYAKVEITNTFMWLRVVFVAPHKIEAFTTTKEQSNPPAMIHFLEEDFHLIKTIRSPRYGTVKERRMVAVLAREYHKIRLHNFYHAISNDLQNGTEKEKTKQKEFWQSVRNGSRFCDLHTKKHYDKLKSMLKEG